MDFSYIGSDGAQELSDFLHPLWVDTHAPIVDGGREWAEYVFPRWGGTDKIREDLSKGHFYAYVMIDGKKAGVLSAGTEGDVLKVGRLYIIPEFRGKGIGSACLEFILDYGRDKGCRIAELSVNPRNENAIAMYYKYGFKETSRKQHERGYTSIMTVEL